MLVDAAPLPNPTTHTHISSMLAAALLLLPVGAAETLMQREYGDINAGLDDGAHHVPLQ